MAKNYEVAQDHDIALMNEIIKDQYSELESYDIHIGLFYAYAKLGKDGLPGSKPALEKDGVRCAAQISLIKDLDRLTDSTDLKIVLDGDLWKIISKEEKVAILDHELYHIAIVKDPKTGEPQCISELSDKIKLKLKRHDVVLWGFNDIIERHKMNSQELQILRGISQRYAPYLGTLQTVPVTGIPVVPPAINTPVEPTIGDIV